MSDIVLEPSPAMGDLDGIEHSRLTQTLWYYSFVRSDSLSWYFRPINNSSAPAGYVKAIAPTNHDGSLPTDGETSDDAWILSLQENGTLKAVAKYDYSQYDEPRVISAIQWESTTEDEFFRNVYLLGDENIANVHY